MKFRKKISPYRLVLWQQFTKRNLIKEFNTMQSGDLDNIDMAFLIDLLYLCSQYEIKQEYYADFCDDELKDLSNLAEYMPEARNLIFKLFGKNENGEIKKDNKKKK